MGRAFTGLTADHRDFIRAQQVFFVATATRNGLINLSPKGLDTLRIVDEQRICWLNLTGSGNETAAHVAADGRMTIMFCAFSGPPSILRLYGTATMIHPRDSGWHATYDLFDPLPGARQIFDMRITRVQTSCGFGVPLLDARGDRRELTDWANRVGEHGIRSYWAQKNRLSVDGLPTFIDDAGEREE